MTLLSPKQQEIRDREQRILQLSRRIVLSGGWQTLSLESLAAELNVSRGTIYNHFPCREEIMLALLAETLDRRRSMLQQAAAWRGSPRLRLVAMTVAAEVFARTCPEHFHVQRLVQSASMESRTTPERQAAVRNGQLHCLGMMTGIVRDALAQDHLSLPQNLTPEDLIFGLTCLSDGAAAAIITTSTAVESGIRAPWSAVRFAIQHLLDGYSWTPLADQFDYHAAVETIRTELFGSELRRMKQAW